MGVRIADHWFETKRIDDAITFLWEPYVDPLIRCNIWHLRGRDRDLLVDTGTGVASLRDAARSLFERPLIAVATHTHYDHVGGMHEFPVRVVHQSEARDLEHPRRGAAGLRMRDFPPGFAKMLTDAGYVVNSEELITAYPYQGFDPAAYAVPPAAPTRLVDEGDTIDLGDRAFEVLHLPGHSPGSIGLWHLPSGLLFSGDAIYDGPLLDELPDSNIEAYLATMERLRALPVTVVHAGHEPSFGRERLVEIADTYLSHRRANKTG